MQIAGDAVIAEIINQIAVQLTFFLHILNRYTDAKPNQRVHRGDPRLAQPDNQNIFVP